MKSKLTLLVVAMLLLSVLVVGCDGAKETPEVVVTETEVAVEETEEAVTYPPAPDYIEFGASIPLTGKFAELGNMVFAGYEIAIEDINAAGGVYVAEYGTSIPIRLTHYDDESDPTKAIQNLETITSEVDVTAYLGGATSGMHAATSAIAEKNQIPYCGVAFALYQLHQQGYRYLFSPFPKTPQQASDLFSILAGLDDPPTKVAIFTYNDDWGLESADYWEQEAAANGFEVVVREEGPPAPQDWTDAILKAKAAEAEVLLTLPIFPDGKGMFTTMAELGWTPKFALVIRAPETNTWWEAMGSIGDYVTIQPGWHHGAQFEGADELNAAFEAKYGRPADVLSGSAYTCVQAFAAAVEEAGVLDPTAVRDAMLVIEIDSVMGTVSFNEDGTGNVWDPLVQWQGENMELVWPLDHATADLAYPAPAFEDR